MKKKSILVYLFIFCSSIVVISTPKNKQKNLVINPPFQIANLNVNEWAPAVAFNILEDDFLVVFEDYRNGNSDIYGQLVTPDGNLKNPAFPICTNTSVQSHPAIAYNRLDNEYLVVWQDLRDENPNVYGQRLDKNGKKLKSNNSLADSSFIICDHDGIQKHIKIAHNYTNNSYLVVWIDTRNATPIPYWPDYENFDVYGQRVAGNGDLLPLNNPPDTKTNLPIAKQTEFDEEDPDVAYHGSEGTDLNEWLVVYMRSSYGDNSTYPRIWGVRIDGWEGDHLNTWGEKVTISQSSISSNLPWSPYFPIGYDYDYQNDWLPQGSPHVESNATWSPPGMEKTNSTTSSLPEFLVVWTDFRKSWDDSDIYCQRVAYFPDAVAVEMGLKPTPTHDSLFTSVLLDTLGKAADPIENWLTWENYPVTDDVGHQEWNGLAFNQDYNEFMVVWNDWRLSGWGGLTLQPADLFGQVLFLAADTSLQWMDENGNPGADPSVNMPLVTTDKDDGNGWYPDIAHSNPYLIVYEFDEDQTEADINGLIYTSAVPVPVELMSFTGFWETNSIILNWQTASESNNYGFEIERSLDSKSFEKVGFLKGYGTTSNSQTYQFIDCSANKGRYYYRLKQIDTDGSFHLSEIIKIEVNLPNEFSLLQNYPNPFSARGGSAFRGNPSTTFEFNLPIPSHVTLQVFNAKGELISTLIDDKISAGRQNVFWYGKDKLGNQQAAGIYFCKFRAGDFTSNIKVILMK